MLFKRRSIFLGKKGIGILEILVVIAILAIVATIVFVSFFDINKMQALEKDRDKVLSVLERARALTLSSSGGRQFGVHIESDKVTLFPGTSYNAGGAENRMELLSHLVTIASSSISGGGSDIIFERLTGKTFNQGTIEVSLKADASKAYIITILGTGIIEIE
jgi:Tfp pilus assembly protein FimT